MKTFTLLAMVLSLVASVAEEDAASSERENTRDSYTSFVDGKTYKYSNDLGIVAEEIHLLVWMVPEKSVLAPGETLKLTIHFKSLSDSDISVPNVRNWLVEGRANLASGRVCGILKSHGVTHGREGTLKVGATSSFQIELKELINEPGFVEISVAWGDLREVAPKPVVVEYREENRRSESGRRGVLTPAPHTTGHTGP